MPKELLLNKLIELWKVSFWTWKDQNSDKAFKLDLEEEESKKNIKDFKANSVPLLESSKPN